MDYRDAGVDVFTADISVDRIRRHITSTWGSNVKLPLGYFANVVDLGIGNIGLAITTDGVGSKSIISSMMERYDTIGIDCIAMNVNDLLCVGATPLTFVDYIGVDHLNRDIIESIAIGLAEGARQAGVSVVGGEISQLPDVITGFDLTGTATGTVSLDKIIIGESVQVADVVIGLESSGLHSNGYSLVRKTLLNTFRMTDHIESLNGVPLGEELLRPTFIYVPEILELMEVVNVKAMAHITGDGLLNLNRVAAPVGFYLDSLPQVPPIFRIIQNYGAISSADMYSTFNMGIGFCVVVDPSDVEMAMSIFERYNRKAWAIGRAVPDTDRAVYLPRQDLIGRGKSFCPYKY